MRTEHYKVKDGKVHAYSGKETYMETRAYDCGLWYSGRDTRTYKPITCKNCLRVIANKKRKKVAKK